MSECELCDAEAIVHIKTEKKIVDMCEYHWQRFKCANPLFAILYNSNINLVSD